MLVVLVDWSLSCWREARAVAESVLGSLAYCRLGSGSVRLIAFDDVDVVLDKIVSPEPGAAPIKVFDSLGKPSGRGSRPMCATSRIMESLGSYYKVFLVISDLKPEASDRLREEVECAKKIVEMLRQRKVTLILHVTPPRGSTSPHPLARQVLAAMLSEAGAGEPGLAGDLPLDLVDLNVGEGRLIVYTPMSTLATPLDRMEIRGVLGCP